MNLTSRQEKIIKIVKNQEYISADELAEKMELKRNLIRRDLALLNMLDIIGMDMNKGYYYVGRKNFFAFAEFIRTYSVEEIMGLPIILEETSNIYDGIVTLFLDNVGSIFLVKDGYLSGVASRKDFLRATLGQIDLHNTPLSIVMTRMPNVKYVFRKTSIHDCAKMLVTYQIDSLPVVEEVDGDDQKLMVVGRITKTNITNLFARLGSDYKYEELL